MKKKKFKSLLLNKKTVSSLSSSIFGGVDGIYAPDYSVNHRCPSTPKTRCLCPVDPTIPTNTLIQECISLLDGCDCSELNLC